MDEVVRLAVAHYAVEIRDGGHVEQVDPVVVLTENGEQLGCLGQNGQFVKMFPVGQLQQEAFVGIGAEVP